jgi:hypothetical protein
MSEAFNSDVTLQMQIGFDASGPMDAVFTWTDVTAYLRAFSTRRGRSHERDTVSAGTATFLLDNTDRRFEPEYASGAYYPNVRPMRPVRIRAIHSSTTYEIWRGFIESFPQVWPQQHDAVTPMQAVDAFKVFAWNEVTDAEVQELSGTRIGNLLDSAGWPAGARSLDTGDYQVAAYTPICVPVLGELQRVVKTEDGLFFMDGAGNAVFHDNSHRTGATSQATFDDAGSNLKYESLRLSYDDLQIWNDVTVAGLNTSPQAAEDSASVTEFGRRKLKVFDTLHVSAANALSVAQGIRDRYKDPGIRVEGIGINPQRDGTNLWPEVLGRELGDLVTVKRSPPGGGAQISADVFVEGIEHRVTASTKNWQTAYQLSPA